MDVEGKVLSITGVGGFIGLRTAELARERGATVRGLELHEGPAARARAVGVETVVGSVEDEQALARAFDGADAVFHTAAVVTEGGDWSLFRRVNVEGTRRAAEVARAAGVRRFVHLSSVMVHGFRFPRGVDEDGPLRGENNAYCQTKIESEQVALSFHEPGGMEVVVIRPGDVYGPGSVPWVVRPMELMRKRLFVLPDGGRGIINHVYVDNLVDAIFLALEKDATGRPFIVTDGAETTFAEFYGRLGAMVGRRRIPMVPAVVLRPLFGVLERGFRLAGKEPPASASAVDFINRPHAYSIARARRELGYEPRVDLDEGMRRIERWVRETGA